MASGQGRWLEKGTPGSSIRPGPALSRRTAAQGKRAVVHPDSGRIQVGFHPVGLFGRRRTGDPPNRRNSALAFRHAAVLREPGKETIMITSLPALRHAALVLAVSTFAFA
ncbi:hypothetical protein LMJ43_37225, partial [Streptomyces rochei]|nr:hypothetical protein [Streptomyces rochei]